MRKPTISERCFEDWCYQNEIKCQPIKRARVDGFRRPDFAIKVGEHWCVVEVKEINPNREDKRQLAIASEKKEQVISFWKVSPGTRLIRGLRDAKSQLRKFSMRGLPTITCFLDNTLGFYDEPREVKQAMRRVETDVISAVGILRKPAAVWVVDLFQYPEPRVRIPPDCAGQLVRKNIASADEE
jgi:hypothetical protein